MARIPVEHERKGSPWWMWLLGLLLLAGVIWLLAELFDNEEVVEDPIVEGVEEVEPVAPVGGLIVEPMEITEATDPDAFIGRQVQFEMMRVVSVPGDSVFVMEKADTAASEIAGENEELVGSMNNRILVVLNENIPAPPDSVEGEVNVNPDQIVRITGQVQQLDDQMLQMWNLPETDIQEIAQNRLYVRAEEVSVMEPADGPY
jgi:hypothetical protein